MEKIRRVGDWPIDLQKSLFTFAMGLRDPKSYASVLSQYLLDRIKYHLIAEAVRERMPETVPYYGGDGDLLVANYHTSDLRFTGAGYPPGTKAIVLKENNEQFIYWTGWHTTRKTVMEVPLIVYMARNHNKTGEFDPDKLHRLICSEKGFFEISESESWSKTDTFFVKRVLREEVPLRNLLENAGPPDSASIWLCRISDCGENQISVEQCKDRK